MKPHETNVTTEDTEKMITLIIKPDYTDYKSM
jgi:hypothetical protein